MELSSGNTWFRVRAMKPAAMVLALAPLILASGVAYAERSEVDVLTEAAAHANAGRHAQAIALYEDVFAKTGDHELLPVLGVEYSWAGQPRRAVQNFCAYLTMAPRGQQAWFATSQVIMIRREPGDEIDAR